MNDRKVLILATLIKRGPLKVKQIVEITGFPRTPVQRHLRGLGSRAYRDEEGYWHVQEKPSVAVLQTSVAVHQTHQPSGRHLRKVERRAADLARQKREVWEPNLEPVRETRAIYELAGAGHVYREKMQRMNELLQEIETQEYLRIRRELLRQEGLDS